MTRKDKLKAIDTHRHEGRYAERICSELTYLDSLSNLRGGAYDSRVEQAADLLLSRIADDGVITASTVREVEASLADLSPAAKSLTEIFVAHAHIDMNWQWGYNETATITVDTFRTMLELMREYPDFTYSQSQASVYRIVEENAPEMLEEIKQRAQEGRWEVSASTWVEADRNMSSGEAVARHHLYTLNYLPKLLGKKGTKQLLLWRAGNGLRILVRLRIKAHVF